jgi:hypothetical protein
MRVADDRDRFGRRGLTSRLLARSAHQTTARFSRGLHLGQQCVIACYANINHGAFPALVRRSFNFSSSTRSDGRASVRIRMPMR